jgi:protein tyrosine phosphatase (PTP) superfamily phosphohydrolase (DUF442 family)
MTKLPHPSSNVRYLALAIWALAATIAAPGDERLAESKRSGRIENQEIENLYRLSPRIYSGAQPEGDDAFTRLEALGIRTVISVDGSMPDVERAKRHGIRYVHLPIGYDRLPPEQAVRMVKVLRELPGPVFVHCHHGKHRGPAAAAFCAVAVEGWSREQATEWMKRAGTAPEYRGLYESVASLKIPAPEEVQRVPAEFPEKARVSTLVESMVEIDALWDQIKSARDRKFRAPDGENDKPLSSTALLLVEQFHELTRTDDAKQRGEEFVKQLMAAEKAAGGFRRDLMAFESGSPEATLDSVEKAYRAVSTSCTSCHRRFRDTSSKE